MYPFVPKSALKISLGDYWNIKRSDGLYGFGVYLEPWHKNGMFVGLTTHVSEAPKLGRVPDELELFKFGFMNFRSILEHDGVIQGNVASSLELKAYAVQINTCKRKQLTFGLDVQRILVDTLPCSG